MKILQKKLFRDLRDLRAQVSTLALLVICGVSVFVSSWSAYQSLQKAKENYYETFKFADIFVDFERAPSDIVDRLRNIPDVEQVEGRVVEDALIEIPNQTEPAVGQFVSWGKKSLLNQIYLIEGHFPQEGSSVQVLVHQSFATAHGLHPGDHLTVFFRGEKSRVQISGVAISPEYIYALSPISLFPDDKHFGVFWMASEILEQRTQMQSSYNNIIVKAAHGASVGEIKTAIDQIMKPYGTVGSYDRSQQRSNLFVENEIQEQKSIAAIIPGIFVFVGIFILNVVMNRLISLQRSQICILKALGYRSEQLAFYYFKLITVILAIGIVPAFLIAEGIGRWYTVLYAEYFHFPVLVFKLTTQSVLLGVAVGFIPGWLSSLRSLLHVFKLSPAEGMRPPSPPSFHHIALEKVGVLKARSVFDRMIYRDLFFHPLRTLAAIVGIAAAIAIMVNGAFWMDTIDFMIKRQFEQVNREDVQVGFVVPRKNDVLNELKNIPGVNFVEGSRMVAVRLETRNVTKETVLIGYEDSSQLRRILSREGSALVMPENGVLLSDYFRKKFGLKAGEVVKLEVLQGKQPTLVLPIVGFVEDIIGASAYIRSENLHRQIQEEPVIDVAFLKVDSTKLRQIYVKLKETPMVGVISVKRLLVESFRGTFANMIVVFTQILVAFAVAISGAVLFNISRITLSEKSWELASLRILGFEVSTVFNLLFVQIGVQVLIATIPGLLLGYWLSFLSTYWIQVDTFAFPLVVEVTTYAGALLVVFLTYLVSGSLLYKKVDQLSMSEALKARE